MNTSRFPLQYSMSPVQSFQPCCRITCSWRDRPRAPRRRPCSPPTPISPRSKSLPRLGSHFGRVNRTPPLTAEGCGQEVPGALYVRGPINLLCLQIHFRYSPVHLLSICRPRGSGSVIASARQRTQASAYGRSPQPSERNARMSR